MKSCFRNTKNPAQEFKKTEKILIPGFLKFGVFGVLMLLLSSPVCCEPGTENRFQKYLAVFEYQTFFEVKFKKIIMKKWAIF